MKDVQKQDIKGGKINKVGVREVYGEVLFKDRQIPANYSCYVSLLSNKGIHMSRLPQAILSNSPLPVKFKSIKAMLDYIEKKNKGYSEDFYIKFHFDYARPQLTPVTNLKSVQLIRIKIKATKIDEDYEIRTEITVPYTSLCPCSKEISKYGAHNQRSKAHISMIMNDKLTKSLEEIIDMCIQIVEEESSCPVYNVLKRPDEKYVTEKAYENPKFVEDVSRGISKKLDKIKDITDYCIVVNHEESIHQHNAVAILYRGEKLK